MILRTLLPDSKALIGAGLQSLVFAREGTAEKLAHFTLGHQGEALDQLSQAANGHFQSLAADLGDVALATEFGLGKLHFRLPGHSWNTTQMRQPLLRHPVDAFSTTAQDAFRHGDPQLRHDAGILARVADERLAAGMLIDIIKPGNVVIDPDYGLCLIDAIPVGSGFHDAPHWQYPDHTLAQVGQQRIDYLNEMATTKPVVVV